MTPLQLSLNIEAAFKKFPYTLPFDRDSIEIRPAESIQEGLSWLEAFGAISKDEMLEHLPNFDWGNARLSEVMNDPSCMENIGALLRNLDYWHKRFQERIDVENKKRESISQYNV